MKESLHALEKKATDEIPSTKLQTDPGRLAVSFPAANARPTAVRNPVVNPRPASANPVNLSRLARPGMGAGF